MFFTQINQLMAQSVDITMVIRKSATGMTVSVLPKSNGLKDEARNHIVPLTLSGLPEELDAGFMNAIANPVRKVSGLLTNMAEFEKQADKAAANSKASKEQKAKETKEEKDKREKYEKHMKKAEELIAARNHKEAITTLGQARLYATEQNRKTVDEKIEEQKRAMNQGSLFDLMEQAEQQAEQQSGQQAPQPVAEQKSMAQQPSGQVPPPQQPRQYVQQPQQQPAPKPMQGQQPAYHRPAQPQMPPQQPYPYPQQGAYLQGAQGGQQYYEEQMQPYYTERQASYQQPPYPPQDEPTYRPEDYEEYPDFPADMIQTPNYQHQTA